MFFRWNTGVEVYEKYRDILLETNLQIELLDRKSSECRIITLGVKKFATNLSVAKNIQTPCRGGEARTAK